MRRTANGASTASASVRHSQYGTRYCTSGGAGRELEGTSTRRAAPVDVVSAGSSVIRAGKYSRKRVVAVGV